MSYAINSASVLSGMSESFASEDVADFIAIADTADECLAAKGVPSVFGQRLKVLFVQHMLTLATGSGSGSASSVSSASGASKSFANRAAGTSGFGDALKDLDRWGCVYGLVRAGKPAVVFRSIG